VSEQKREPLKQEIYRDNQIKRGMKSIRVWLPAEKVEEFKTAASKARDDYAAAIASD
jgi:hypothetical protein